MRVGCRLLFRAAVTGQQKIRLKAHFTQVTVRYFSSVRTAVAAQQSAMKTSQYGSWKSPISSELVTKSGVGLLEVRVDCNTERTGKSALDWATNKGKNKHVLLQLYSVCHILSLCCVLYSVCVCVCVCVWGGGGGA